MENIIHRNKKEGRKRSGRLFVFCTRLQVVHRTNSS